MIADYLRLATGSLRKRFLRTSLTMIGIFIGIAAVVALISLGQGMQDAINAQFASVGSDKITIQGASAGFGPPGQDTAGSVREDDLRIVRQVSGVAIAAGRLFRGLNIEYADETKNEFVASLPKDQKERDLVIEAVNLKIKHGRQLKPGDKGKIVIGYNYWAEELFPKNVPLGANLLIQGKQFEVVGLMDKIGAGRDDAIIMNEEDLRDLTGTKEELSAIFAQVAKGETPSTVAERVTRALRRDRGQKEGQEDFTVQTSEELIGSINTILNVVQAVFIGIAAISLLVGGVGIMNTMYTSVLERNRDIGIMKAIGARNSDILWIFLIESGLLGMAGGAIGVALGVSLSKLVEIIGRQVVGDLLQATFSPTLLIGAILFSFLIGAASGVMPALAASKLPPVVALRGD
ncbi:ABC transporter permease [Candidatus Woesearchaeota archaeon]|nr:MAG: ABC transporter permease [Candidatus Woesearchaeota archaeon]